MGRQLTKEQKERKKAWQQEWRKNNPEKNRDYYRKFRERHRDRLNEWSRKYREENRDAIQARRSELYRDPATYEDNKKKRAIAAQKKYYRFRNQWIQDHGPCVRCGGTKRLEVDHINPSEKELSPAKAWFASPERREKELAKCQVLCKSCHGRKTAEDQRKKKKGG